MATGDAANIFREEALDLLVVLESALLSLEEDPGNQELVATAFRALHTIKGSGAMFGFDAVASFTHHLENAFERVRDGKQAPTSRLIGITLAAKDHIRALIEAPTDADSSVGESLLARLAELHALGDVPRAQVGEPLLSHGSAGSSTGQRAGRERCAWHVRFTLAAEAMVRGGNPLLLLDELRALGDCTVTADTSGIPSLDRLNPCGCDIWWDVRLVTERSQSDIEDVFIFVSEEAELTIEPEPASRVDNGLPAVVERKPAVAGPGGPVAKDTAKAPPVALEGKSVRSDGGGAQTVSSIRVPAERLDNLMDQVGELVIAQARLKQLVGLCDDVQIKAVAEEIERLSNGLRDTTMGIRTVPIGSLFDRFRRLVRDLSQELGKTVALSMAGGETELDKTVIERLNDPLVHIIRNSLDHGLEDAEERIRAGKPPEGHVHLSATHSGAQVLVTVKDDGRGIDAGRILAKAEDQGIVARGANLSESEVLQLIFHPGLSTAQTVTSVSGRGVGMDVVKRTIDALRGSIEIDSTPGEGTEITLRLPLTLAIIDGLLVRVGHGRYVIPLSAVEECVELPTDVDQRRSGRNFLSIRGDLVPFLRLREAFRSDLSADLYQKIVIVSAGDRRVGLVVDQVIGDHQTVIKSLSKLHADVGSFSGATILGDGSVALILDVGHLVARGQSARPQRQAS